MFLCAREASTGPSGAPPHAQDALNSVVNVPATSESQSSRQSRVLTSKRSIGRSPEASEDGDSSAYLQVLNALTRLVAQLLDVHTLSPALRFSAGEQVAVDAVEWWKEVQKQSIALVQRLQASAAAEGGDEDNHTTAEVTTTSLWSLASPQQQQKPQEQQEKTDNQISMLQCEAFAELPEDKASGFCIQALYLVMRALERVNRRKEQRQEQDGAEGLDGETLAKAFATVDSGVAFAAAQLLQSWVAMDQTADIALPLSDLMGVAVVNAMLQSRKIGTRHTFHKHTLLASLARRAFPRDKEWSCSVCNRVTPTTGSEGNRVACVYRCAACNFNLCRECFTRIPNVTGPHPNNSREGVSKLGSDRLLALTVPQLDRTTSAVVVRQVASELRRRVLELYPHNFRGAADFAQLFHELVASDKRAAIALVLSPPASVSSSRRPTVAWFPLFMRTWTMSQSTLLGPFLRASTVANDTDELDAAVRAVKHSSAVADSLRAQWTAGYSDLREILQSLMQTMLSKNQHPLVVDATLCWLALTLLTADPRRRLNYDVHERLDGFLANVTSMLLSCTLPVLDKAQHEPNSIDASYHQSIEPVRVCASKDFPEVPLHYSRCQDARVNESIVNAELAKIRSRDEYCIAEYNAQRTRTSNGSQDTKDDDTSPYYPRLSCHEGVVCDRCEYPNFHDVRYKCAFCGDMDLCSACFEDFRLQQASAVSPSSSLSSELDPIVHNVDHVFIRIESPIPVFALKHFQPLLEEGLTKQKQGDITSRDSGKDEEADTSGLQCADCGDALGVTKQPGDVFYQCANCLSPRTVCVACLTREEKLSNGNPHKMHAPGHVYFVVTDPWRRQLPVSWGSIVQKLHLRRLLHPPALIPRLRFPLDTEVFYMTLKYLHFGPLSTVSRWLSMVKEVQELQAFCSCDEERLEMENQRQQRIGRRRRDGSQRQSMKPSVHYKASKARLDDLRVKCVKTELHVLESANVAAWLIFYGRTCRWLLHTASAVPPTSTPVVLSQDPFTTPLTDFSSSFSAFPEHFFFDLCDVVYLLGLEKLEYRGLVTEMKKMKQGQGDTEVVDEVTEVVEPLLVMLTQIVVAPKFTKNPHLRVEALRSLTTLLTFVSKGQQVQHRTGHRRVEALFKRHELLSRWLIPGILQFHSDMDRYNASNNGLAFTSAVTSGDHMLWGFLPTRVAVTLLLRYLWQLPSQQRSFLQMLNASDSVTTPQSPLSAEPTNNSTQQLTGLVSGLWSDIAKLFDEANSKITTLRQIHDLIEDSLDGSVVVLPFRRDMLDGYVAINSKQLRLTLRLLLEALELTSWLASIASGENSFRSRSLSPPAAALRHVLLQPLVVEQAARTLSFLVASLANAHEEKEWAFSHPLLQDGKLLLAHLIVLVVRYSGHNVVRSSSSSCSPSSFWKIVRASGDIMERRVGDLDTQVRWGLNALCTRIESESYLGSTSLEEDGGDDEMCVAEGDEAHELDEDEALALLEKQAAATSSFTNDSVATKRLGKRFIATLAKDGRFDFRMFVGGCRFLRPPRSQDGSSSESDSDEEPLSVEDGYLYLDDSWVQQFVRVMQEADEMIHVQEAMEACLGDIPDQYLDPLLSTLMTDPVRLPSGNIVDRAVIARHLLASSQQGGSTGRDPFTREPLTMAMVEPCDALRVEIQLYLRTKMRHFRKTAREDVLATWGLGWDVLFDSSSSETEAEVDSEDGAEGSNSSATAASS